MRDRKKERYTDKHTFRQPNKQLTPAIHNTKLIICAHQMKPRNTSRLNENDAICHPRKMFSTKIAVSVVFENHSVC